MPIKQKNTLGVIRLHNAVFYAYHGVLLDEQNLGGKFEVDVDLHCDLLQGAKSDHLDDTVNYERVYDCIRTSVLEKKHLLLENAKSPNRHRSEDFFVLHPYYSTLYVFVKRLTTVQSS